MYGQNSYQNYPYSGYGMPTYGQRNYMQPQQQIPQQPQMQQPQQQPMLPTVCYAKMEEAKPFIITNPNASMLFIDREKNKALLKSTDHLCNSYSRYFDLKETDENGNLLQAQKQEVAPQVDYSQFVKADVLENYVQVAQYQQLANQYNMLVEQLNAMKKIIAGGKPNVNNGKQGN